MPRLKYEFKHLGLTGSAGYNPNYIVQDQIAKPDDVSYNWELNSDLEIEKGITSSLDIYGATAIYVRDWLIDHANAPKNSILVRITNTLCTNGNRGEWLLKADGLTWELDSICKYRITLREYDAELNCLQSTLIADNHRGWFPPGGSISGIDPLNGLPLETFMHPRYRYCDDIQPQALQNFMFVIAQSVLIAFNTIIGPIFFVLNLLDQISQFLGFGNVPGFPALQTFIDDVYETIFAEFLGCNRVHPSPFVRNYFENGCSKCGISFISSIFQDPGSLYYNAAHLFAPVKKGFKIDSMGGWIDDNQPIYTVWLYARSLRRIFNAKYILKNGVFRFERKDFYAPAHVFDFTTATDKAKLLSKIQLTWSGTLKPAYQNFTYTQDAFDQTGNQARHRFNDIKDWNVPVSPLLSGEDAVVIDKYSTQRYTNDGIDKRVIFKALNKFKGYLDGLLIMSSDMTSTGKLIIWDTVDKEKAEAIRMPYAGSGYDTTGWPEDYAQNNDPTPYYIYNQPFYYDPTNNAAFPNIFDFHKIDDPQATTKKAIEWSLTMDGCCEDVTKLMFEVPGDTEINTKVDNLVKLSADYEGVIRKILINEGTRTITLSGVVK